MPSRAVIPPEPNPGDLLVIGAAASVQFAGDRGFLFRVIEVDKRDTYYGWLWIAGYVLNRQGTATDKREIFIQRSGLRSIPINRQTQ